MSASSSRPTSSLKLSQDKFFSVNPKEDLNEAGASRKGSRKSLLHRGSAKGWFHRTVDEDDTRRFSNTFEKPVPLGELDRFRQDVDKRDSALESAATDKLSQKVKTMPEDFYSFFKDSFNGGQVTVNTGACYAHARRGLRFYESYVQEFFRTADEQYKSKHRKAINAALGSDRGTNQPVGLSRTLDLEDAMDEDGFLSFDGPFVRLLNGAADHPDMLKLQYFLGMYRQDFMAVPSGKNSESGNSYAGRELPAMSRRHDFLLPRGRKYLHWSFANALTFGLWGDLEEALELLHKMRDAAQLYVQQSGVTRSWSKNVGFFVHCCPSQKDIPGPCALHIIDLDVRTEFFEASGMNLRIDAVIEFLDAQRALGDSQLATEQLPEFRPGEVHSKVHRLVDGLRADAARDSRLHVPVDVLLPVVLSDHFEKFTVSLVVYLHFVIFVVPNAPTWKVPELTSLAKKQLNDCGHYYKSIVWGVTGLKLNFRFEQNLYENFYALLSAVVKELFLEKFPHENYKTGSLQQLDDMLAGLCRGPFSPQNHPKCKFRGHRRIMAEINDERTPLMQQVLPSSKYQIAGIEKFLTMDARHSEMLLSEGMNESKQSTFSNADRMQPGMQPLLPAWGKDWSDSLMDHNAKLHADKEEKRRLSAARRKQVESGRPRSKDEVGSGFWKRKVKSKDEVRDEVTDTPPPPPKKTMGKALSRQRVKTEYFDEPDQVDETQQTKRQFSKIGKRIVVNNQFGRILTSKLEDSLSGKTQPLDESQETHHNLNKVGKAIVVQNQPERLAVTSGAAEQMFLAEASSAEQDKFRKAMNLKLNHAAIVGGTSTDQIEERPREVESTEPMQAKRIMAKIMRRNEVLSKAANDLVEDSLDRALGERDYDKSDLRNQWALSSRVNRNKPTAIRKVRTDPHIQSVVGFRGKMSIGGV
jgi:hypothetical protein